MAGGLMSVIQPSASVGFEASHQNVDTFSQALSGLYSQDAAKRREAQQQVGALTQVAREIAANPREESATREVAREVAQALERALQASRRMEVGVSDTTRAGVQDAQTQSASVDVSAQSTTAFYQTLASALGHDPNDPASLQKAAAFAHANPQMAQALVAQARPADDDKLVLNQGGPGPQTTPDALLKQGRQAVGQADANNRAQVERQSQEYLAAQAAAARAMTGLNPRPDGRIGAQALYDRLNGERKALEGKAGEQASLARVAHGATAAAVRLAQEEMRRNGEDFSHIDPRRVEQIRDQLLGAALGGPGGGGNARLRGELEKAGESDKNLHDARLMFIERNAGL
ncbi:MAG: hypothetical protein NZ524_06020, partial [Thiobacillaceae bacterium]|nr:hypothetical protein [Thiobacillaceae bacterium]